MAGSRSLKLSILADIANFTSNMDAVGKKTSTTGNDFDAFAKKATVAFSAAATAVSAYVGTAIKNAAEDEKAQRNLALTIENTTRATAAQIAGVEQYISKTSLAIGITDDQLRPAFGRLVRSTKDVEDAQKLLNLALDVSAATGKPLEAVANALGKAYDGNLNALGRLGLGIDQSILKSKDFDLVFQTLTSTFGGFAANEATSTEAAFARIKIASDEVQEQIGAALLPIVEKLTTFILENVVPAVQAFVNGLTGEDGLVAGMTDSETKAYQWGQNIKKIMGVIIEFKDELIAVSAVIAGMFVVSKISAAVTATIALIRTLITTYNALKASALVAGIASAFALNPLLGVGAVALAASVLAAANALVGNDSGGSSAPSTGAIPFSTGFTAPSGSSTTTTTTPKITVPSTTGITTAAKTAATAAAAATNVVTGSFNAGRFREAEAASMGTTINLTVTGAFEPEGTARTIVDTLNNSYYRGTGGGSNLAGIA